MLATLTAAAALLLAQNAARDSASFSDSIPPAEYRQDRTVTLQAAGLEEIRSACEPLYGAPPAGQRTWGCEVNGAVIVPNPCSFPASDFYAQLLCHEIGHAAGWPASHPGGQPLAKALAREKVASGPKRSRRKGMSVRSSLLAKAKPAQVPTRIAPTRPPVLALLQSGGSNRGQP